MQRRRRASATRAAARLVRDPARAAASCSTGRAPASARCGRRRRGSRMPGDHQWRLVRSHAGGGGAPLDASRWCARRWPCARTRSARGGAGSASALLDGLLGALRRRRHPARARARLARHRRPDRAGRDRRRARRRGRVLGRRPRRARRRGARRARPRARPLRAARRHRLHELQRRQHRPGRARLPRRAPAAGLRARRRPRSPTRPPRPTSRCSTRACTRRARTAARSRWRAGCASCSATRAARARAAGAPRPRRRSCSAACRRSRARCSTRSTACGSVLAVEINVAGENALMLPRDGVALPNGNFHAGVLTLALDALRGAMARVGVARRRARPSALLRPPEVTARCASASSPATRAPTRGAMILAVHARHAAAVRGARRSTATAASQTTTVQSGIECRTPTSARALRRGRTSARSPDGRGRLRRAWCCRARAAAASARRSPFGPRAARALARRRGARSDRATWRDARRCRGDLEASRRRD